MSAQGYQLSFPDISLGITPVSGRILTQSRIPQVQGGNGLFFSGKIVLRLTLRIALYQISLPDTFLLPGSIAVFLKLPLPARGRSDIS